MRKKGTGTVYREKGRAKSLRGGKPRDLSRQRQFGQISQKGQNKNKSGRTILRQNLGRC
jgi:hypothetical protein